VDPFHEQDTAFRHLHHGLRLSSLPRLEVEVGKVHLLSLEQRYQMVVE
jgi:hypothetical protein